MEVTIVGPKVLVTGRGVSLLRLKAEISLALGDVVKTNKEGFEFPDICLPLVQDLIPSKLLDIQNADIIKKFSSHESARDKAYQILRGRSHENHISPWDNILDPPQAVAVAALATPGLLGACLFDEQGSGKTVMAIAAYDTLRERGHVGSMIVICPKSMLEEWRNDIERFLPRKYRVIVASGSSRERAKMALSPFDVFITNYESVDDLQVLLASRAEQLKYLLVVDESFYLKNAAAVRSEAVARMRGSCEACFVLCGTPAPNNAYDLINQFDLADLGFTFSTFRKTADRVADQEVIENLVATKGTYIRRLKTEILGVVAEKRFHIVKVRLSGRQALLYEEARAKLELELKRFDNTSFKKHLATYFQRRSALLQICASPRSIGGSVMDDPVKLVELDKLLDDLISQGRKVVIWTFFKSNLEEMMLRYEKYKPVRIDGSINSIVERRKAVSSFQNDDNVKVFIGNPAAAGAGITLHSAYDAVYVSYSNQAAHYLQSLDRIHRRGQVSDHVNYYLLTCEGTIEETEVKRLRQKEIQQHSILGDFVVWPTSLDDALDELHGHD